VICRLHLIERMAAFDLMKTKAYETYMKTVNAITSVSTLSEFKEGVLTPEEFLFAGEALVYRCPTWSWAAGDPKLAVPYLPPDKQFLITKNVPCLVRVVDIERQAAHVKNESIHIEGESEDWVGMVADTKEEILDIPSSTTVVHVQVEDNNDDDDDDIPDMDSFEPEDNEIVDNDQATIKGDADNDNIIKTRTYDISIHYDKYYRTPRVWLFGYDENRNPLKPEEIFADISQDHAKKNCHN